jgi:hypothetical protein
MRDDSAQTRIAWKLLFHWKAWQWTHENALDRLLGRRD